MTVENKRRAEVIAIGDEMTSGQRLDTNTRWLSQALGDLGVEVAFHSTVGDDLTDMINVIRIAAERTDIVVCTGGLGPTADDLTREAIAEMAGVSLKFEPEVVEHIRRIFAKHSREMPERNLVQAYFPDGATIIDNPEGTAPGIDFLYRGESRSTRLFALPGVPYEMKQMWSDSVAPAIREWTGQDGVIHHHVLHCFGTGESQTEAMLPELIRRGREPRVGITASFATISLRVTAKAATIEECQQKIQPTLKQIRDVMGDYLFGENNVELQDVVVKQLERQQRSIAVLDTFLKGDVAKQLMETREANDQRIVRGSLLLTVPDSLRWLDSDSLDLVLAANKLRKDWNVDLGVAIGPLQPATEPGAVPFFEMVIAGEREHHQHRLAHGGHSQLRHVRGVKQVLNQLRLHLQITD